MYDRMGHQAFEGGMGGGGGFGGGFSAEDILVNSVTFSVAHLVAAVVVVNSVHVVVLTYVM